MRSFKTLGCVSAGVLLALAGGAQAATSTTTFAVTASVAANCLVTATPMAFGPFDGTVDLTTTSTIGVRCTNNLPYTIALDVGTGGGSIVGGRTFTGPGTLTYNLYRDGAYANVWGTALADRGGGTGTGMGVPNIANHTVHGRLLVAGNELAPVGNYTSTILVTVEY